MILSWAKPSSFAIAWIQNLNSRFCIQYSFVLNDLYFPNLSFKFSTTLEHKTAQQRAYEVKWVYFKWVFCNLKVPTCPWPQNTSEPLSKTFKQGPFWWFISRGIRNTRIQSQKFKRKPISSKRFGKPKAWILVFLRPLEIKPHTLLHLKAINT